MKIIEDESLDIERLIKDNPIRIYLMVKIHIFMLYKKWEDLAPNNLHLWTREEFEQMKRFHQIFEQTVNDCMEEMGER